MKFLSSFSCDPWRAILGGALFFAPALAPCEQPDSEAKQLAKITKRLEEIQKRSFVPGMAVVIVRDDKIVYRKGFGLRDVAKHLPVTPDTVFCIGSTSKAFTCLLATQAAVDGKLKLTDNPTKYIPSFVPSAPEQRDKLTISDIMSHRSGFPRTDFAWWAGNFTSEELVQILDGAKPTNKIGEKFLYQNMMLMLTGLIDAKVYGEPYADLVQHKIFEPLGMAHTSAHTLFLARQTDHATGYASAGPLSPDQPLDLHDVDAIGPAGSIVSTANDLGQWLRLQLNNGSIDGHQLFSSEAILEQRKPRMKVVEGLNYGFGWMLGKWGDTPQVDHGGNVDGYSAEVSMLPEKHLGVAILTNANGSPLPNSARTAIYEELVGPETPTKPAEKTTAKNAPKTEFKDADASLAGTYECKAPPLSFILAKKGPQWTFTQGPVTLNLKKIADVTYAFDNPAAPKVRLSFVPNEKNPKVTELLLEQGSIKLRIAKAPPYNAPMSVENLIARAIEAVGGVDAYKKLGHSISHFDAVMPADGVHLVGIRYVRGGVETAQFAQAYALKRWFANLLAIQTPTLTAELVGRYRSYPVRISPTGKPDSELDLLALLHPKQIYSKLAITAEEKVDGESAYVLEGTDRQNFTVDKSWYSTKTFRLLKRSSSAGAGAYSTFGDYRQVDGVWVPFKWTSYAADGSPTITEFQSYDFTSRVPDWPFKFPASGKAE
jgi:CubicO group peptidase (beta-lactamase class C family)